MKLLSTTAKTASSIFLIMTWLFILGCKKDAKILNTSELLGAWQLIEADSDLTDGNTPDRVEGYKMVFNPDSTFTSEKYEFCHEGTFSIIDENHLLLEYDCPEKETLLANGKQIERFELKDGHLYLVPTYSNCIEGCYYKFEKISD